MINSVTVTNHFGDSIKLELRAPETSGFLVQRIDGLGPSSATVNTTDLATIDGSLFNSAKANSRNIVFDLKLLAAPTIEATRQRTYKYFPIKKQVALLVETDTRSFGVIGYVESNEPNIFSKRETTQISIICPNPYFYGTVQEVLIGGITNLFTFPFSNESLDTDILDFGTINTAQQTNIVYEGDNDTGFIIGVLAKGNIEDLVIYNAATQAFIKIDTTKLATLTGLGITTGDEIIISTVKGNKYISLIRAGETINILNALDLESTWLELVRGTNVIAYAASYGEDDVEIKIQYQTLYEGV